MPTEQQRVWVEKVLGVNSVANQGPASSDFGRLVEAYRAASAEVDDQINAFQNELLDYDDEDLNRIASDELNMIFGSERLMLEAALARGPSETVAKAANTYAAYLRGSRRVAACDENEFGVHVAVVATLGPVLDQLSASTGPWKV